jgi:hypothetical protein
MIANGSCPVGSCRATTRRSVVRRFALAVVFFGLATGGCGGGGGGGGGAAGDPAFLLAPENVHYGATYSEWSVRWWQWAFELPRTNHPLRDLTGSDALRGQVDPVWFLGGFFYSFGVPQNGPIVRNVTIPSGRALFFPVVNFVWDNTNCLAPDTTYSFSELHQMVSELTVNATDLFCEVDGVRLIDSPTFDGAERFRAQSPAFETILPDDNLWFDFCSGVPMPARTVDPVATDGIYVMLAPLSVGSHVIRFTANAGTQDMTYNITVTP